MAFDENTDHSISLGKAAEMTKRYRDSARSGAIIATAFGKTALQAILDQEKCVGIRMYYAKNENGDPALVLTGLKANEDDIYEGELAEYGADCPPRCSTPNDLNS
ncbi:MAG: hypothetical protein GY839_13055 [candidate division Zixibacteria bacterium]|nr:hypothetical protein [candidate division Zixibacteria bacterium]